MITKLESYLLAWYFAAMHTVHDCFEKRGQKGLLFTIGDEPNLEFLPKSSIEEIMGITSQSSYTDVELLKLAQEKYDVYHIIVNHSYTAERSKTYWQNLLGQNCVVIDHHSKVADTIANIVISNVNGRVLTNPTSTNILLDGEEFIDVKTSKKITDLLTEDFIF
jgi:hypothetical protein